MNVHANDPTVPAPGEMLPSSTTVARTSSPQPVASSPGSLIRRDRDRQPSLGELHQELEAEQEAQVVSPFAFSVAVAEQPCLFNSDTNGDFYNIEPPLSPNSRAASSAPATSGCTGTEQR